MFLTLKRIVSCYVLFFSLFFDTYFPFNIYCSPLHSFSAEFDFRTYDPEGVILFAGGHLNSSWIVLAMHHGKLELQLKYGSVSRVTSSGPIVNDGQWRKVGGFSFFVKNGYTFPDLAPLAHGRFLKFPSQISVEEQGRSLVIKIDREAVMKIAVNGALFSLRKEMHELNLTVGGVPFREDGLVNQVGFFCIHLCIFLNKYNNNIFDC